MPLGSLRSEVLEILKQRLPGKYTGASCGVARLMIPCDVSLNPYSGQHHATMILDALERQGQNLAQDKLLGVTDLDLYVPNLNFVFGEARLPGRVALISTYRLMATTTYGGAELFPLRLVKEAVHELGHTLGLSHCDQTLCVMHFSNSLADTDRKSEDYCESCLRELGRE